LVALDETIATFVSVRQPPGSGAGEEGRAAVQERVDAFGEVGGVGQ
jgi:hypothetical protein